MRVKPSQLVTGCILLNDVIGKTDQPIMTKQTVLSKKHITVLKKFLVDYVDVSRKLNNGEVFEPAVHETKQPSASFLTHYLSVVDAYKNLFTGWQNNVPIDMASIRNTLMPLLERMTDITRVVHTLHRYATKKDYFFHHGVSVAILSAYIGKKMGYSKGEWLQLGLAGFLSDIGMAKIRPDIRFKTDVLNDAEYQEVKKHPIYSYRMIEQQPTVSHAAKLGILQHHERVDGSGYPLGLKKNKIHRFARIIAVCDIYHAMISERYYKDKQSPFLVIDELHREQFSKLDPQIVQTFIESLINLSTGVHVRLSNGQTGVIVFIQPNAPTRPIVKLDANGDMIALQDNPDLFIAETL